MNNTTARRRDDRRAHAQRDFHGAALITSDGHEVPITEEMVRHALRVLERSGEPAVRARTAPPSSPARAMRR